MTEPDPEPERSASSEPEARATSAPVGEGGGEADAAPSHTAGSPSVAAEPAAAAIPSAAAPSAGADAPAGLGAFAAVRSLAGLTLVSRLLGFGRDVLMATTLGTGLAADAFFLAWMVPNLFRRLFGDGAFAAALVPVFVEARERGDHEGARRLVQATVVRLALGLTALVLVLEATLAGALSESGLALLGAAGLGEVGLERFVAAADLARILVPYLVFICLAGVLGGALNALDRFAVPAAAPAVFNVIWIGAVLASPWVAAPGIGQVRFIAWVLLAGGAVQLLMHTRAIAAAGLPVRPTLSADPKAMRRVRNLFLSLAVGMALFQLNVLLDGLIAYSLVAEQGGVSALYYGNRLVQLPIGVLGVALATAVFPELARRAKRGDLAGLGAIVDRGLALGAFVAVPAAVGLAVLAEPIVQTLFERGAFDGRSTERTGRVLLLLAPAVVAACMTPIITRAFYAEEDVKTPVRLGAACVLLNLVLNLLLVGPLGEAGLALATTSSQLVNLVAQAALHRRRRRRASASGAPSAGLGSSPRALATALALAAPMAAVAWGVERTLPAPDAVRLAAAVASGAAVYGLLARLLRVPELALLLARRRRAA